MIYIIVFGIMLTIAYFVLISMVSDFRFECPKCGKEILKRIIKSSILIGKKKRRKEHYEETYDSCKKCGGTGTSNTYSIETDAYGVDYYAPLYCEYCEGTGTTHSGHMFSHVTYHTVEEHKIKYECNFCSHLWEVISCVPEAQPRYEIRAPLWAWKIFYILWLSAPLLFIIVTDQIIFLKFTFINLIIYLVAIVVMLLVSIIPCLFGFYFIVATAMFVNRLLQK